MRKDLIKIIDWSLPYVSLATMIYIIMYPQIISHGVILGTDSIFHFNRFYDAAKQIQQWNWSYFQSNYSFQQSGRVINAVYGPLFAYLNGILLGLLGSTWFRYQIVSSFLVYFIGGVGMYHLALKMKAQRMLALLISMIFLCLGWLPRWEMAQNMNAWGAAIAPYCIMIGITMIEDRNRPVHWMALMTLMTIIIQIHLLSSIFFTLALIPFFVIGLILANNRKQMLIDTLKSVVGTIILTGNVWGALLMLKLHNHIAQPAPFDMVKNSLKPSQFNSSRDFLIYFVWLIFLAQLIYVLCTFRKSLVNTTITLMGSLILYVSSIWFPWAHVEKSIPALTELLQFPNRLTVIAYPLLLAGIAYSCQRIIDTWPHETVHRFIIFGVLIFTFFQVMIPTSMIIFRRTATYKSYEVLNTSSAIAWVTHDTKSLRRSVHTEYPGQLLEKVEKRSPDYLPIPSKYLKEKYVRSYAYQRQIIKPAHKYRHKVLSHGRLMLTWNAKKSGTVRLPIITYQESQLVLNGKTIHHYHRSKVGAPYVYQRKGKNTVILSFHQSTWFTYLMSFSLIALALYSLYGFYRFGVWLPIKYRKIIS